LVSFLQEGEGLKKMSKLQHLTQLTMQLLCLTKTDSLPAFHARWFGWVLALVLSHASLGFAADTPPAPSAFDALQIQAQQWASSQPSFQGRALHVAPIDNRIAVQSCQQSLQFDQPFPGQASVRVRCGQPIWQLYVTLNAGNAPAAVARNGLAAPAVQKVLVAKEMLKRGTLLTPAMFTATEMPAPGMESQLINDPKLIVNMELSRDLTPNTPLKTYDVKTAVLVRRGQEVQVTAGVGQGFLITMRAESLQDGGMGEQIRLKNSESGRSLTAVITGPNAARLK
jgi:flagella basal body P-ring formation protein FlgA